MTNHSYNNPDAYSKNNALQYNFALKLLKKISFDTNSRILDIGCGDGLLSNELAQIAHEGSVR